MLSLCKLCWCHLRGTTSIDNRLQVLSYGTPSPFLNRASTRSEHSSHFGPNRRNGLRMLRTLGVSYVVSVHEVADRIHEDRTASSTLLQRGLRVDCRERNPTFRLDLRRYGLRS